MKLIQFDLCICHSADQNILPRLVFEEEIFRMPAREPRFDIRAFLDGKDGAMLFGMMLYSDLIK